MHCYNLDIIFINVYIVHKTSISLYTTPLIMLVVIKTTGIKFSPIKRLEFNARLEQQLRISRNRNNKINKIKWTCDSKSMQLIQTARRTYLP